MKILLFLILFLSLKDVLHGQTESENLLDKLGVEIPERSRTVEVIVEKRLSSLQKYESFIPLGKSVQANWQQDLKAFDSVANSAYERALYFKAAQTLDRVSYISFLREAVVAVREGRLANQQFKWGLFPSEKHLREMWTEDPPSSDLKILAHEAGEIFADDAAMISFLKKIESGGVGQENTEFERRYYGKDLDGGFPKQFEGSNDLNSQTGQISDADGRLLRIEKPEREDKKPGAATAAPVKNDKPSPAIISVFILSILICAGAVWYLMKKSGSR